MVLVTVYDIEGNKIDDLGGFYVSDTVEGRVSAKAIIRDNPNVEFCKLEVYDKVGGRLLATSGVFNRTWIEAFCIEEDGTTREVTDVRINE